MTTPASIRYNNPGAQYPGTSASRFGSIGTETIGGGHKIAVFDDPIQGAAAQFDLLRRGYAGMTVADAIRKWSGGNFSQPYVEYLIKNVPGLTAETVLTPEKLRDPAFAIPFARASASWEAGRSYPMTDAQWTQAHGLAFGEGGAFKPADGSSAVGVAGLPGSPSGPTHGDAPKERSGAFTLDPALPGTQGGPTPVEPMPAPPPGTAVASGGLGTGGMIGAFSKGLKELSGGVGEQGAPGGGSADALAAAANANAQALQGAGATQAAILQQLRKSRLGYGGLGAPQQGAFG